MPHDQPPPISTHASYKFLLIMLWLLNLSAPTQCCPLLLAISLPIAVFTVVLLLFDGTTPTSSLLDLRCLRSSLLGHPPNCP